MNGRMDSDGRMESWGEAPLGLGEFPTPMDAIEFMGEVPLLWGPPISGTRANLAGVSRAAVTYWATEESPGRFTSFETRSSLEAGVSYHLTLKANPVGELQWVLRGKAWGEDICTISDHPLLKLALLPELLAVMGVLARENIDLCIWETCTGPQLAYARSRWKVWLKNVPAWVMRFEE